MLRPRVLVADDDADMRRLVSRALRRDGCDVVEVVDGEHLHVALTARILQASSPDIDLLVTDVRMPGRSGLEVVEMLRGSALRVPVIVMTAFGDEETKDRARRAGAILFDKPFGLDDLRAAVGVLLRFRAVPTPS